MKAVSFLGDISHICSNFKGEKVILTTLERDAAKNKEGKKEKKTTADG